MSDLRPTIKAALATFEREPLREAATGLLATLGYKSDRTLDLGGSSPEAFQEFVEEHDLDGVFNQEKALFDQWTSADLLFQLTDEELAGRRSLFEETMPDVGLLRSYLFFAINLQGGDYSRSSLTAIARQINRVFPMPVMVLIKHTSEKRPVLSIAVINRRRHKREADKDVLGKVTIIRDIAYTDPHRGHLDILASLALPKLEHPQRLPITSFDALHTAWEQIFNVELLNERFYRELSNWYFWALPQVQFPADTPTAQEDDEKHRATALIRLLTRIIFCWFIKEKDLVPEALFNKADLTDVLVDLDDDTSTYYQAILQNLFFATLNTVMGKDRNGQPHRSFAYDEGFPKNRGTHGVPTLFRYEEHFQDPDAALDLFADVPFLNGGLFESLDRDDPDTGKRRFVDGFTRIQAKRPHVPNKLFFAPRQKGIDLSDAYGEKKRRNETARGLLHILHGYKFTIVENTPIDQEIALDPELLGKVFENLLASYNEETETAARKQTGSFYTPRSIVEYMVDEALKAHLAKTLVQVGMTKAEAADGLGTLFAYTEKDHPFVEAEVDALLDAIHASKILDPACGSGAFPMGVLQKLVYIIHKLDPDNEKWKRIQIKRAQDIPDSSARDAAITAIERDFEENEDDYGRKLYLIESCLYGVDIQPIAIQISKLRFFISLVADQRTNRDKSRNRGVRPLPNLETKFVAADTLIGLPETDQLALVNPSVPAIEAEIESLYHRHFTARSRTEKLSLQRKIKTLREELARLLAESLGSQKKAEHVAEWDPFDPQTSADFFDPHWMFGQSLAEGFDIVIGNPPYGAEIKDSAKIIIQERYKHQDYQLDTYLLFIEQGVSLLRAGGIQSLIIPNTWLPSIMLKSIRSFVFGQTTILSLVDIRTSVFSAVVDNTILTHAKEYPKANSFPVLEYTQEGLAFRYLQKQDDWFSREGDPISIALTPARAEIAAMISKHPKLEVLFKVTQGCKLYQTGKGKPPQTREIVRTKPFTSEVAKPEFRPLLRGKHVTPFSIVWNKDLWVKYGPWLAEPRLSAGFEEPIKVLVRQTGDTLIAAVDTNQYIAMDNLYTVRARNGKPAYLRFLSAFLNSSLLRWYYQNVINPERGEALAQVKKAHLVRLPIAEPVYRKIALFNALVSLIQLAKTQGKAAFAQFFEDLIDACVMECYFSEHMAERDILFHEALASPLAAYDPDAPEAEQTEVLDYLYRTLNAPDAAVRNRLIRIPTASPDLLALIQEEGRV